MRINTYENLVEFEKSLPKGDEGQDKWIFRGEKDKDGLKTTLEKAFDNFGIRNRKHKRNAEKDIIREFQRKLHLYTNNLPSRGDIIQWLAIMQHHGAPTRLLDWTYSFWVAVHFAIVRSKPGEKVVVWAVKTTPILEHQEKISEEKKSFKEIFDLIKAYHDLRYCDEDAITDNALVHSLIKQRDPEPWVYASSSFRLNERITIQQGTFLIPGDIRKSFKNNLFAVGPKRTDYIQKGIIKITIKLKKQIIKKLREMNINNTVLFPGLDGFSESLWSRAGLPLKGILSIPDKKLDLYP